MFTNTDVDALSDTRTVTLRVWRGYARLTVAAGIKQKRQDITKLYAKEDRRVPLTSPKEGDDQVSKQLNTGTG